MPDSWRHSLIECSNSRCVWALVDDNIVDHILATRESNAKQWLFAMILTVVVTLWALWHARRKIIHEDIHQSPMTIHLFVSKFIAELERVGKEHHTSLGRAMTIRSHAISMQIRKEELVLYAGGGKARSGGGAS